MKIFIVIPTHNEEKHISIVLREVLSLKFPIVVVDDGSCDGTSLKLNGVSKNNKKITILTHKVNLGKGAALKTGCEYAFKNGAEAVIMMDSDGQHATKDINKFIEKLETKKYDVILGSRNLNFGVPFVRYIGNKLASVFVSLLFGIYVSDLICGYRGITKKAYKKMKLESSGYGIETEMVIKIKTNSLSHCEVPVETIYYDGFKGVSVLDALSVFGQVVKWRFKL